MLIRLNETLREPFCSSVIRLGPWFLILVMVSWGNNSGDDIFCGGVLLGGKWQM